MERDFIKQQIGSWEMDHKKWSGPTVLSCVVRFISLLVMLTGCMSVTTFQSPKVLDPGEKTAGIGVGAHGGYAYGYIKPLHIDIFARIGLMKKIDAGIKLYSYGVLGDMKYQVIKSPLFTSLDIGFSYVYGPDFDGYRSVLGAYPMLIIGTERYYTGAKFIHVKDVSLTDQKEYLKTDIYTFPAVLMGASFGNKLKIIPELNIYCVNKKYDDTTQSGWKILPIAGLGFQ
ncbi:MAG: hypothetical protein ABIL22_07100, partial [candidate division WOR-3 bacterium]